jgi:hypothetical protein
VKTKDLIQELQEADPTGELEVCVNNVDIFTVTVEPAYWDGKLQVLKRDPALKPYYDVVGAKYVTTGSKVVIDPMSITDLLWSEPEVEIDYSDIPEHSRERYIESDNKTRQAGRDVEKKVAMDAFYRWVKKQSERIRPGCSEDCRYSADRFFEKNLTPHDPIAEIPPKQENMGGQMWTVYPSYNERQELMWDNTIQVYWEGGWGIRKKDGSAVEEP